MIRAVLDTNIIISGLFWQGPPRVVLRAATLQAFTLLFTPATIAELNDVLSRDKFAKLRAALGQTAAAIVADLEAIAEIAAPADIAADAVRDPKDVPVLACAVGGSAHYLVTGDADLLTLSHFQEVSIVTPARFLKLLVAESGE